ncbi:DNA/RNA-binding protein AlbA [Candidatus Nitrosopumilus koreensis AR1]|uniref:DNA/RNA-binding protein Alba n=1 Tax=Candidatus Nitrosopumilus koreensis AR1 TaxID=1229908 RepID=K0B8F1_9ARCH|nr:MULTISPECIES: DNA-binding protein [Nitrosopumilus]AFS81377.1 DNA/RNA-binding protein AlbA [Candidatus Nitrosopumilus koreensis AR1]
MLDKPHDTIFIGKKPLMSYVTSAIIQLSSLDSIVIKARGMSIGLAVDVTQVLLKKTDAFEVGCVKINSESLESQDGRKRDVSTIEIPISKKVK